MRMTAGLERVMRRHFAWELLEIPYAQDYANVETIITELYLLVIYVAMTVTDSNSGAFNCTRKNGFAANKYLFSLNTDHFLFYNSER